MKHTVRGFLPDEDYSCYEQEIKIALDDLKTLMGWEHEWMVANDHRLNDEQIKRIERACSIQVPVDLEIFLMTRV